VEDKVKAATVGIPGNLMGKARLTGVRAAPAKAASADAACRTRPWNRDDLELNSSSQFALRFLQDRLNALEILCITLIIGMFYWWA